MSTKQGCSNFIADIKKSFHPINPFLKVFSLNCDKFQCQKYTVFSILTFLFPAVILGCIDAYSLYYKILYTYKDVVVSIKYTDIVQVIFDYFQYIVDLFVVITCKSYLETYYKTYQKLDEILGIKHCATLQRKLRNLVIGFGVLWAGSCACDYFAWVFSAGFETASTFAMSYIFILIKIITSVDMTSHVLHIEFRLRNIADIIDSHSSKSVKVYQEKREGNHANVPLKLISINRVTSNNLNEIKCLCKCYLWVVELTGYINQVFGTRVLLNSLSILIDMVRFTNIAARILIGTQHLVRSTTGLFPVFSTMIRLLTCVIVLLSLARHCEMAYAQRMRIVDCIDKTNTFKEPDEETKSALSELRQLVLSRSIDFQMSNLTRFDYALLGSMTSMVVTYTIILLQSVN